MRLLQEVRVFIASPGDVADERAVVRSVVDDLNAFLGPAGVVRIEVVGWENVAPGMGRPQETINFGVDDCDLFLGLLWSRWGTETGTHASGFHEEFSRAVARHDETGEPEVCLFFKAPPHESLADPGPQLSRVLQFRAQIEAERRLLYREFQVTADLRQLVWNCLGTHLRKRNILSPASPRGVHPAEDEHGLTIDSPVAAEVLDKHVRSATDVPFQFPPHVLSKLPHPELARVVLSANASAVRLDPEILLHSREAMSAFHFRQRISLEGFEQLAVVRAILADASDENVGWTWLTSVSAEDALELLWALATSDRSEPVRRGAFAILSVVGKRPDATNEEFREAVTAGLNSDCQGVPIAAASFLAATGHQTDIDAILSNATRRTQAISSAIGRILLREDPTAAVTYLTSLDGVDDRVLSIRNDALPVVSDDDLPKLLAARSSTIQALTADELRRRRLLSGNLLDTLIASGDKKLRNIALAARVERGELGLSELRETQKDLSTDLTETALQHLPDEQLKNLAEDWGSPLGSTAYFLMGMRHFDELGSTIRTDIRETFRRLKEPFYEQWKPLGSEAMASILPRWKEIEGFIEEGFIAAALRVLAEVGSETDCSFAETSRHHHRADLRRAAATLLARHGANQDLFTAMSIAGELYGADAEAVYVEVAQRTSVGDEVWKTLVAHENETARGVALRRVAATADWAVGRPELVALLRSGDRRARVQALTTILHWEGNSHLEELLVEYLAGHYYFDVVCWLDRLIFAPEPIRGAYQAVLARAAHEAPWHWWY